MSLMGRLTTLDNRVLGRGNGRLFLGILCLLVVGFALRLVDVLFFDGSLASLLPTVVPLILFSMVVARERKTQVPPGRTSGA